MAAPAQGVSGYFVWEAPGRQLIVYLRLQLADRLAAEIRRGPSAQAGAEVGGILIGTVQPGYPAIVRIEDFEPVACQDRSGPAYLPAEESGPALHDTWLRWQPNFSPSAYAVGFFRSHVREGFELVADDVELMDRFFPDPSQVAMVIKPSATGASMAKFFAREGGVFTEAMTPEFPLRRGELMGETTSLRPSRFEPRFESRFESRTVAENFPSLGLTQEVWGEASPAPAVPSEKPKASWQDRMMWLPLSLAFLLLGGVLGFEAGLTIGTRTTRGVAQEYAMSLAVAKSNDNLHVTWNRQAPVILTAQKGVLEIEDGGYTKPVELDAAQLRNGTLIYRNSADSVVFRLTIYPYGRVSVTETTIWKQ